MKHLAVATALAALLMGTAAQAADMPVKARVAAPVPYSWTGCFVGVAGGGTWGRSKHVSGDATTFGLDITDRYTMTGGIVGVEYGCQWQSGSWVFGSESDFSWTNLKGSSNNIAPFNTTSISGTKESWFSTTRARLGYLATDSVLLYVTGGLATARVEANVDATIAGFGVISESHTRWGWTVGAGAEFLLGGGWSAKADYLYARFTDHDYFNPAPVGFSIRNNVPLDQHIFRLGLNYKFTNCPFLLFGCGPVVARY